MPHITSQGRSVDAGAVLSIALDDVDDLVDGRVAVYPQLAIQVASVLLILLSLLLLLLLV